MSTNMATQKKLTNTQIAVGALILTVACGIIARLAWTNSNSHDPGVTTLELEDYPIDLNSDYRYADDHRKINPD